MTATLSRNQLAVVCLETKPNSRGGKKAISESSIQKKSEVKWEIPTEFNTMGGICLYCINAK